MSIDALKEALESLDERTSCEGVFRLTERLALALPDGDVGAADDPKFVTWLLAHSELAPFGEGEETKTDVEVRNAQRVLGRGEIQITGFEPAAVLPEIEAAFASRVHLQAQLLDVLVYGVDGHFARHKDTPRTQHLVGTLVVEVPVQHAGGAFHVDDGTGEKVFDWSGGSKPGELRWVALFSDVDHRIAPVTSGTRVTLVYALVETQRLRSDPASKARLDRVSAAAKDIETLPLMIACTRQVITVDRAQPMALDVLRGSDREIADALVGAGFRVAVRAYIATGDDDDEPVRFPGELEYSAMPLAQPLPPELRENLGDVVSFAADPDGSEYEIPPEEITVLAPYMQEDAVAPTWLVRPTATATAMQCVSYSMTGYFGNEGGYGYIYSLAALEVTR